ncbi:hypothetical protein DL98DRAFT_610640 [Cadophora sp. DSE1049]|nr:hypothetical protein DL98DRAFT_610640 [Cadophora sp. DSE1049]
MWKNTPLSTRLARYSLSLEKVHRASLVYRRMASATIDPSVALNPLSKAKWAAVQEPIGTLPSRPVALSIIALFDGGLDIDPEVFKDVIAVSSRDSLYVSESLLDDPTSTNQDIRCLVGNIGKAGMALLLSPQDPIMRTQDPEDWEMVNHQDFDGRWEDNFRSTSLHLKLTGYEYPINTSQHGNRRNGALYAEAAISAHAQGQWIADIDILNLFERGGKHMKANGFLGEGWLSRRHDSAEFGLLTSIDSWAEFLDRPPNTSIIRAKGNWSARLALAALMLTRNDDVLIASGEVCWACVRDIATMLNLDIEQLLILC